MELFTPSINCITEHRKKKRGKMFLLMKCSFSVLLLFVVTMTIVIKTVLFMLTIAIYILNTNIIVSHF